MLVMSAAAENTASNVESLEGVSLSAASGFSGRFTGIICVCSGGVMDLDRLQKTAVAFLILPLGGTAFDGLSCVT